MCQNFNQIFIKPFKDIFQECNYFIFICIWTILTIYEFYLLFRFDFIDPIGNPKYIFLCNITIIVYSLTISHAYKRSKLFYITTFSLPISLMVMEYFNYYYVLPYDSYAQILFFFNIYHFTLLGIVLFLLSDSIICKACFFKSKKILIYIHSLFELVFLWIIFSLIANAILNSGIDSNAIIAIGQTNFSEAWHYYWGRNHGVSLTIIMFIIFLFLALLIYKSKILSTKSISCPPNKTQHFNYCLMLFTSIIFVTGIRGNMYTYYKPLFWRTLKSYRNYRSSINQYPKLVLQRQQIASQYANLYNNTGRDGLYVLIIGESLNRQYMGCYNLKHNTTPFQQQLKEQPGTVFFQRVYACDVYTTKVVPMMLTMDNQYILHSGDIFAEGELSLSLLDIAKASNFNVFWISNQETISSKNSIIPIIAASANQCIYLSDYNFDNDYDLNILSILNTMNFSKRSLVIIHLIGNHYPYKLRFPSDFTFPANLGIYEKSVYYNDYVIQKIVDFFQSQGASIISYVSDHSEGVSVGKGHDSRPDVFCREMIEIPMWFWFSDEYREQYPNLYENFQSNSNKVITNDLVFNIYMDLMQFQHIDKIKKYSPLSDNYILDTEPPKTLDGQLEIPNP